MIGIILAIFPFWFKTAFSTAARAISALIFIAAIASWIPQMRGTKISSLLDALTEPIVAPVRRLLNRVPLFANLPIDFSPLATLFIVSFIGDLIWYF